jgi:diguanylate cyclase (GGDEF)-like protein
MFNKLNIEFKDNSLKEVYNLNLLILGWVTVIFLLPFAVNSIFHERYIVGALVLFLVFIAAINSLSLHYKEKKLVPYWFFFFFKISTLVFAIFKLGYVTAYWSYPLAFIIFFVQPLSHARVMAFIMASSLIGSAFYLFEIELVSRFALTLIMLMMFCDVFVRVLMTMESKLSELAIRDPLTNAHNRRYMNYIMEMTIEETRREFGPATIVMLDIDHFKKINDQYGHAKGDTVLIKLVNLLHQRQRKLDYVFRSGGEEFVMILRNTGLQQALSLAENLRVNIEGTELLEGEKITVSLGVAEYQTGETEVEWLHRADELLYEAKDRGRNCVQPDVLNELYD